MLASTMKWIPLLLLLPGCLSLSKKEKQEHLSSAISLQESKHQALCSSFQEGPWPKENWWDDFQSPSLSALIEEALLQSPSLKAIESRIMAAQEEAKMYRSKLLPTLFFNADDNWRHLSKHGFTHLLNPKLDLSGYEANLSLAFQYEFDFWGKYRNLFKSALGRVKASAAELAEAALILSSSLAQSYFAFLITQNKKALYEELLALKLHKLTLQNKLVKGALSSNLPPLEYDQEVKQVKQDLLALENELESQRHLINILRGVSPDAEVSFDALPAVLSPPPLPSDLSLGLLSRRPDLLARLWYAESLAHEVGAAKADFFPSINLTAFAGLTSISFANLFQATSQTTGVNPSLSLPLFTGGSIKANVGVKKALFTEAIFQYNDLLLRCVQEVADLLSHLNMAFSQKRLQETIINDSEQRLFLVLLRQQGGLDSEFSSLSFQEELLQKKLKNLDILYNEYAFSIKLIQALGGGYEATPPFEKGDEAP